MKKGILLALVLCVAGAAHAKALEKRKDVRPFLDSIMQIVAEGKLDQAISTVKPYMTMPEEQVQGLALQVKSARQQAKAVIGETIGYEYLGKKVVGDSLIRFVYLEKTENLPLTWVFVVYRNGDGWVIPNFQFNAGAEEPFYRDYDAE